MARRARLPVAGALLACAFALSTLEAGCTQLSMKRPEHTAASAWPVKGHDADSPQRDRSLHIGSFVVDDVAGTPIYPSGMSAYGRAREQDAWDYTFRLEGQGQVLFGSCHEQASSTPFFKVNEVSLDLRCTCSAGNDKKLELTFQEDGGLVLVGDVARYALAATRASSEGKRSRSILGYRIVGGHGGGGVDVSHRARAYLPATADVSEHAPLACAYAALLLHKAYK